MSAVRFTKMHGAGNDYVYVDCFDSMVDDASALAVKISDRHFGVGGDGLVLIAPSKVADARMIMYNMDGSEGNMCGNAIRCVAKFMHDERGLKNNPVTIETKSGIKTISLYEEEGKAVRAKVDMGAAVLDPAKIPVTLEPDENGTVVGRKIEVGGSSYKITCVSMGNPHAVVFVDDVDGILIEKTGPLFENNEIFPERVNTEFIKVIDDHTLQMRVWERGSGETLACGTGACAAAVASVLNGYCPKNEDITVKLRGGDLMIRYTDDTVYMTGPCVKVFEGTFED
ncbi:MAG: diaminopimelate epimerase [Clostridiales bacterium]|nr:diaminopimelate epimerase [Clostridiales bacterium]